MNEKERINPDAGAPGAADGAPGGGTLNTTRQKGQAFLAASQDAIKKAISGDSAKFNQSARQQGGQ